MLKNAKVYSRYALKYACLSFLLIAVFSSVSVAQVKITGTTLDSQKVSLAAVVIKVFRNNTVIATGSSNDNGAFEFFLPGKQDKPLVAHFTSAGFKEKLKSITIAASDKEINIGAIYLEKEEKELAGITVVAEGKIYEQKVDRFIFNVEKSILANGSNGWDALSKTPGLRVNGNVVSIIGKSGVMVMVNDRRLQLSGDELFAYLSSIPSENIATVEVISNPGARYDASGNGGIVNIRLKKNKNEGLLLVATVRYEQRPSAPSFNGNIAYNYRKKNITVYGFLNMGKRASTPVEYQNIFYPQSAWKSETEREFRRNIKSMQWGVDFSIGKKNLLTLVTDWNIANKLKENDFSATQILKYGLLTPDSVIQTKNKIDRNSHYNNFDISFKHNMDQSGSYYSFTFDYLRFKTNQFQNLYSGTTSNNIQTDIFNTYSRSPHLINNYSLKFDFLKNTDKNTSIGFGAKAVRSVTDNDFEFYDVSNGANPPVPDVSKSNHFNYTEDVLAFYVNYNKTWEKHSLVAGARGEQTDITGKLINLDKTNKQSYFKLFPSFSYQYVINKKHQLNFNYGRRINRPIFSEMNPFRYYINEYNYTEGNPGLIPSFSHNFEITYTFKEKYSVRPYVLLTDNFIYQVPAIDPVNQVAYFTTKNIGSITAWGVHVFIPIKITKWWTLNNTLYWFNYGMNIVYLGDRLKYNQPTAYGYFGNQFKISEKKGITAEINCNYQSASQIFLSRDKPYGYVDCGFKWVFDKKRATLNLGVYDLFHTYPQKSVTAFGSQNYTFLNKWESRYFRISFTRRFGKQTVKDKRATKTGNADEFGRANSN